MVHFYGDDTIIYCCACTIDMIFRQLQLAFDSFQSHMSQLRLVLNAEKTKSNCSQTVFPFFVSAQGISIETMASYKYLGIIIDDFPLSHTLTTY